MGGTLDPLLRGKPEGSTLRCWMSTGSPDGSAAQPPGPCTSSWVLELINPGAVPPPRDAGALFVVAMDIAPQAEDEFNEWYDTEHIPALLRVPRVMCARRFRALDGSPRYFAIYHLSSPDAYGSEPWCAADRTPWIRRLRQFQSNRTYSMFRRAETSRAAPQVRPGP